MPPQIQVALNNGFNPTTFAAEALRLALAGGNGTSHNFETNFGGLSVQAFATAVSNIIGVSADAIQGWVNAWINFYTAHSDAHQGLSVTLAAFGDAVGVALLNDTSANLKTNVDFNAPTISGLVANALIDNAEGLCQVAVPLGSLPAHQILQGEAFNLIGVAGTVDMAQLPATIRGSFEGACLGSG